MPLRFDLVAHPEWLWLLGGLPILALWMLWGRNLRIRDWAKLGQSGSPVKLGMWGWLAAMVCLIVALAQPRWGRVPGASLPPGQDVVLLVDVSRSMGAEDAVPNRLGVAIEAADSLLAALGKAPGSRAAVVAFAGRGAVRCPLTENLGAVADALHALRPGQVEPGGTNLGAALEAAAAAFDEEDHAEGRSILLFSDGEDHAGTWQDVAAALKASGLVVHSVAIGDPERGHPVPSRPGAGAPPLTYRGQPVASKRSDAAFDALARQTGGAVVRLGLASADLGALYETRIAPVAHQRRERLRPTERVERYPAFVLAALAFALAGSWPRRRRWGHGWEGWLGWGWQRGRHRASAVGLGLGLALAGVLGAGPAPDTAAQAVAEGRRAFASGDFRAALAAFERAMQLAPDDAVPRYDAASALYQLGRYRDAAERYGEAREHADAGLRTKIDYALGNTALARGDVASAVVHYEACLASRVPGAAYDAVRQDAEANRQFALEHAPPSSAGPQPGPTSPSPDAQPGSNPPRPDTKSDNQPGADGRRQPRPAPNSDLAASSRTQADRNPASPESRLASALDHIRDARRRRLADEPPDVAPDVDRKDW